MENPLSPETLSQVQALARQISVAHHLDPEIQAELITHLEDQLRAYLTGSQKLTEDDALLLTRTHFGNPAAIKSLLQRVHVPVREYALTVWRSIRFPFLTTAILLLGFPMLVWLYHAPLIRPTSPQMVLVTAFLASAAPIPAAIITIWRAFKMLLQRRADGPLPSVALAGLLGCYFVAVLSLLPLPLLVAPIMDDFFDVSQTVLGPALLFLVNLSRWMSGRLDNQLIPGVVWMLLTIPALYLFAKMRSRMVQGRLA